jgi:hypothetical protein
MSAPSECSRKALVAQIARWAVRAGLQGRSAGWLEPTVSIEAGQVSTGV